MQAVTAQRAGRSGLVARPWRALLLGAGALVAAAALACLGPGNAVDQFAAAMRRLPPWAAISFLYLEESGVPLLVPGDVFVLTLGQHLPRHAAQFVGAWLGLIAAMTLGATNLYLIARRVGQPLAHGRLGRVLHLTPDRMARAEHWLARYGPVVLIFGRHVPGLRVPITVAAGMFRVPYPLFAASVAASSAIWAAVFLGVGVAFGSHVIAAFSDGRGFQVLLLAAATLAGAVLLTRRGRRTMRRLRRPHRCNAKGCVARWARRARAADGGWRRPSAATVDESVPGQPPRKRPSLACRASCRRRTRATLIGNSGEAVGR